MSLATCDIGGALIRLAELPRTVRLIHSHLFPVRIKEHEAADDDGTERKGIGEENEGGGEGR